MAFKDMSCADFAHELASKNPVPGGGSTAALVGTLGAALASMVCNLTAGKKKYAHFEEDILTILRKAEKIRLELMEQIEGDVKGFEPMTQAYRIPKDDPKRDEVMEQALRQACIAPAKIIGGVYELIDLLSELAEKGSILALSDVGCGAQCCRAAALSAWISIRINTRDMKDREYAEKLAMSSEAMVLHCRQVADDIYDRVLEKM